MKTLALLLLALAQDEDQDLRRLRAFQERLKDVIDRVKPAYVFIGGGSGVCISEDGWILTNHHVAGDTGRTHRVFFTGGKSYNATVIGHDPLGDISLLKINGARGLPFCELGDSDKLKVGQHVIAVGNPFLLGNGPGGVAQGGMGKPEGNWEPTVTFGIISALHRFKEWYMDAIQTDAQINPGNSGGPLITLDGKVIGINGRIEPRQLLRVNTGVGYAIPSNQIKRYLPHLKKGGRVYHGYIDGIVITECGSEQYENSGEYGDGVLVAGVQHPSPASEAGLQIGDIIVEVAGYRIFNTNRLYGVLGTFPQNETVTVKVRRGTEIKELRVWLGDPKRWKEDKRPEKEKKKPDEDDE